MKGVFPIGHSQHLSKKKSKEEQENQLIIWQKNPLFFIFQLFPAAGEHEQLSLQKSKKNKGKSVAKKFVTFEDIFQVLE